MKSNWRQDTGGTTQRSGPVFSNTLINDLCEGTRVHSQQVHNTTLNRVANTPHEHTAFQRNIDSKEN